MASLDAPLSDEGDGSLLDVVAAPVVEVATPRDEDRAKVVVSAVRRLGNARQRAVLRRRFGLPGYGISTLKETAKQLRITTSKADHARRRGLEKLAQDARLASALGVEVRS